MTGHHETSYPIVAHIAYIAHRGKHERLDRRDDLSFLTLDLTPEADG